MSGTGSELVTIVVVVVVVAAAVVVVAVVGCLHDEELGYIVCYGYYATDSYEFGSMQGWHRIALRKTVHTPAYHPKAPVLLVVLAGKLRCLHLQP